MQETMLITEKNKYSTKDIAVWIRQQLKAKYPSLKISVVYEGYSGGSSINVSIMESKQIRFIKTFEEIPDYVLSHTEHVHRYNRESIKEIQKRDYHQLNHNIRDYNETEWCNGVFLTKKGNDTLGEIMKIVNCHNYDNSDSQIDYFDVNYYVHLQLGKYNKPFIDGNDKY